MKILTLRRMLGIAIIGTAYVHGKRRGDWTLASITDTLNYLWTSASERFGLTKGTQRPIAGRAAVPGNAPSTSPSTSPNASATSAPGSAAPNGLTGDRTRRPYNG